MSEKLFSEQLRQAVLRCGKTRYRICMDIDIKQNQLSRFVKGQSGLSLANIDKLLACIGGQLVTKPVKATKPTKAAKAKAAKPAKPKSAKPAKPKRKRTAAKR